MSVRDAEEAVVALAGGAEILDVKEPTRGPLGMADAAVIREIVERGRHVGPKIPLSVALGEVVDTLDCIAEWPDLSGIGYVKFGTSRLAAISDIVSRLERASLAITDRRLANQSRLPHLVLVAYADFERAESLAPEEIAQLAVACRCAGLLIDTFCKREGRLVDWLDAERLARIGELCRSAGLAYGLAGRLHAEDLALLLPARPDVIGIRSAACRAGMRNGPIDLDAINAFRRALGDASRSFSA